MKLVAVDQVQVTAVRPHPLTPGEEFEVADDTGELLLRKQPRLFRRVADTAAKADTAQPAEAAQEGEKAEDAPQNKAESAPANKADTRRTKKKAE
jgi:hypothetical protein